MLKYIKLFATILLLVSMICVLYFGYQLLHIRKDLEHIKDIKPITREQFFKDSNNDNSNIKYGTIEDEKSGKKTIYVPLSDVSSDKLKDQDNIEKESKDDKGPKWEINYDINNKNASISYSLGNNLKIKVSQSPEDRKVIGELFGNQ